MPVWHMQDFFREKETSCLTQLNTLYCKCIKCMFQMHRQHLLVKPKLFASSKSLTASSSPLIPNGLLCNMLYRSDRTKVCCFSASAENQLELTLSRLCFVFEHQKPACCPLPLQQVRGFKIASLISYLLLFINALCLPQVQSEHHVG